MSSRGTAAAAALLGGAALAAGLTAWRVLSAERSATVVPLQRLARKYRSKSRAGLVPVAKGAAARALRQPVCCSVGHASLHCSCVPAVELPGQPWAQRHNVHIRCQACLLQGRHRAS